MYNSYVYLAYVYIETLRRHISIPVIKSLELRISSVNSFTWLCFILMLQKYYV